MLPSTAMTDELCLRIASSVQRGLTFLGVVALTLTAWSSTSRADGGGPVRFAISFPAARSAEPLDGRVLLFISDDGARSRERKRTSTAPTPPGRSSASTSTG